MPDPQPIPTRTCSDQRCNFPLARDNGGQALESPHWRHVKEQTLSRAGTALIRFGLDKSLAAGLLNGSPGTQRSLVPAALEVDKINQEDGSQE